MCEPDEDCAQAGHVAPCRTQTAVVWQAPNDGGESDSESLYLTNIVPYSSLTLKHMKHIDFWFLSE